jgi:HPt (histidine-containing phosphotransfer) domain-containing protein
MSLESLTFSDENLLHGVPGLSAKKAIENLGGRADLYLRLLTDFYKAQVLNKEEFVRLIDEEDKDTLYRMVHTLKSNTAYVGAFDLSVQCHDIELAMESNKVEFNALTTLLNALTRLLDDLKNTQQPTKQTQSMDVVDSDLTVYLNYINKLLEQSNMDVEDELLQLETLAQHHTFGQAIRTVSQLIVDVEYERAAEIVNHMLAKINE